MRRPLDPAESLEDAGFGAWDAAWLDVRYFAARPVNLRFVRDIPRGSRPEWARLQPRATTAWPAMAWDGIDYHEFPRGAALGECLWDYMQLRDAPDDDLNTFVSNWGLPTRGYRPTLTSHDVRYWPLKWLRDDANELEAIVDLLIATEAHEVVNLEALFGKERFGDLDERAERFFGQEVEPWKRGGGLDYQRDLACRLLLNWSGITRWSWKYDSAGRSSIAEVTGANDLIGEHFRKLFDGEFEIYRCSICERPYPFTPGDFQRRPRRDRRRFCSEDCRKQASLERKRAYKARKR